MDSRTLAPRCIHMDTFVLLYKHPIGALYILHKFLDGAYSVFVDSLFNSCSNSQTRILQTQICIPALRNRTYVFDYISQVLNCLPLKKLPALWWWAKGRLEDTPIAHSADHCASQSFCLARTLSTSVYAPSIQVITSSCG